MGQFDVVNRALVYGVLTACVVGIYVLVVGYLGVLLNTGGNLAISLLATGLVAVLFQPLRERLQRAVDRIMYGERDDPYLVVSRLGQRLEAAVGPEAVLPTIVETVGQALKLPHVSLWLIEGDAMRHAAVHGPQPPEVAIREPELLAELRELGDEGITVGDVYANHCPGMGAVLILPVAYGGELLGTLVAPPRTPDEAFSAGDRRLLRDLARRAGAAVHAVQLTDSLRTNLEELRRSRERLLVAQEEERRRIQRDLHDGLGPTLASLRLRLEACLELAPEGSIELSEELTRLHDVVGQTTADIRRLVNDLRPPSLDQLGLVPALHQHAEHFSRETGVRVHIEAEPNLVVPAAVEVAVFRIAQEALVNVQRHARASHVDIRLEHEGERLAVHIRDNGLGLAADATRRKTGTGLRGMRERAELLGGTLEITSDHQEGTELWVSVPDGR